MLKLVKYFEKDFACLKSRLNSWILLGILGVLVVVFWDVIKYKIEDLQHDYYLSQVKEREEYYKNHVEEALKKDSECFEKGGDKVDCSAAMRIASGERNRRMLEIK
ncbi:hypothetical protein HPHPH6_1576 [Helicobacter pylori Hp H-6]|uniref:Uncharacterized protein n=1 Tax=Helicobacter pylori Hp H-6 TaxID=992061 RepID=J0D1F7_HELPX|nr:hypothetical protein HPHPH6_1576 [Helicobacter pylori Hp H-6]